MIKIIVLKMLRTGAVTTISSVIAFVAGALLSTLFEDVISSQENLYNISLNISIIIILISIFTVITIQLQNMRRIIQRQKLAVSIGYASTKEQDKQLYASAVEVIAEAQKSIQVIGMYRPPDLALKAGRRGYYDLIEEVVDYKIQQNDPFIYERVVQVGIVTPAQITSTQVDPITFSHCKKILQWKKQKSAVSAHVKQMPYILSSLSLLIVDDEYFFLAIPDIIRNEEGDLILEGLQLTLNFHDPERKLTEQMKTFFARMFNEADTIVRVIE